MKDEWYQANSRLGARKIMNTAIPSSMQAVQQDAPNGKLVLRNVPVPQLQAGQVLVRMAAAPINPSDLGGLQGYSYAGERTYPFTPGLEGSGRVVAAGGGLMGRLLMGDGWPARPRSRGKEPGRSTWSARRSRASRSTSMSAWNRAQWP